MLEFLNIIKHVGHIRLVRQFYIKNLPQPWQTLVKILMRCLTTKVTGIDQPPLHMMKMFYCIINNVHVDYVALIWEVHLDILKRTNEVQHYVTNDEVVQSVFNSRKIDVSMTQSQPTKSSQGTNRTISAPKSPNPQKQQSSESSTPKKTIIIRILKRKQPDPETSILTAEQINVANFDEATQVSISLAKSVEEYESQQNVKCIKQYELDEDVEMLVEGEDSVVDKFADEIMLSQDDLGTRINPGGYKESPEA
nr:hypothetical protein [Tanacetum cinerariifolium]